MWGLIPVAIVGFWGNKIPLSIQDTIKVMKCGFSVTVSLDRFRIYIIIYGNAFLILCEELEQGVDIDVIDSMYPKNVY